MKWIAFMIITVWFVINEGLFALSTAAESKRLPELIEGARREGQLNLRVISEIGRGEMELIGRYSS